MEANDFKNKSNDFNEPHWNRYFLAAGLIIGLVAATPLLTSWVTDKEPGTAGEFGDMFGSVNALFSGLAFLGVVVAILLQRQELALQRAELASTREVLTEQRHEMTLQNEAISKQQFESMFFQMVSLHNQIVNDLDCIERKKKLPVYLEAEATRGEIQETKYESQSFRGRNVFEVLYRRFKEQASVSNSNLDNDRFTSAYNVFHRNNSADLGHYFRNLFTVIKYVDEYAGSTPQVYVNIVRAQLSAFELVLLFYNCTCGEGRGRFKTYVEKYALLEHLEKGLLLDSKHEAWMEPTAFEEA